MSIDPHYPQGVGGRAIPKFYGDDLERMVSPPSYASPMDRQTHAGSGHRIDQTSQFIDTSDQVPGLRGTLDQLQKTLHGLQAEAREIETVLFGVQPPTTAGPDEDAPKVRDGGATTQIRLALETAQRVQGWLMKIRERL